ncbi:hypothetical protein CVT26_016220 [Gymnopilus dilepis]|uniref:Afadin and alpha-actinin-binding-domain-containing protein n=1 Tax=Gymnopilus dilepis TaxID=231916 RepID=A0A409WAA4_9AGAR|nr:hypothetical protein CVT26_016220 [Gymnopilus dilepis]
MAETPRRAVHWDNNSPSLSNLDSPFFNATYETSVDSTSSLEFVNAQLVAHGFAPTPGLSLEGISNESMSRVVKCLLALLSQRMEDMNRAEDLTTKLRTLSYDYERMKSLYNKASEQSANAEREMNLHKSRLAATVRSLQASENAHKQTSSELQRTRTLLQGVRATYQAELKKKEKEVERVMEKWQKLADSQAKLSAAPSGIRCANVAAVEGDDVLSKGQSFLEIALEQAEQARNNLSDENLGLRKLILRTVNEVQLVLHHARSLLPSKLNSEEPVPFTLATLFPLSPPDAAREKLDSILKDLRESLTSLSQVSAATQSTRSSPQILDGELERLQGIVKALKEELSRTQEQNQAHVADTQAMFDKFAADHRIATGEIAEMSIELMSAPLKDEEKERLDILRKELDAERQKFTEAAIRFGKEKAELEAERIRFLDEKRSWEVEKMLADLPPTPAPASPAKPSAPALRLTPKKSPRKSPHKSPHKSPRKSPAKKVPVGKAGTNGRRAHRVSRTSLSPMKMMISYETELMPPIPPPSFSLAPRTSLLPTSFVLPPPSPRASLPTEPALPPPSPASPPEPETTTPPNQSPENSPPSSGSSAAPSDFLSVPATPQPVSRGFPVAKPFAPRIIHAYSPAKPSPLSRILMLNDSPLSPPRNMALSDLEDSPPSGPLEPVMEEPDDGGLGPAPPEEPPMSLAAELGVSESPPDTPLQERRMKPNVTAAAPRGRVFFPEPKKPPTVEKGKARAKPDPAPRARPSGTSEKENSNQRTKRAGTKSGKVSPVLVGGGGGTIARKISPTNTTSVAGGQTKTSIKAVVKASTASASNRPRLSTKPSGPSGGGPRRVPIDSADAPPIGKGWK